MYTVNIFLASSNKIARVGTRVHKKVKFMAHEYHFVVWIFVLTHKNVFAFFYIMLNITLNGPYVGIPNKKQEE